MPNLGGGLKAAFHGLGATVQPETIAREINLSSDLEPLVRAIESWMPGAAATFRRASACMYSLTPDGHFVIDRHPQHPNLIVCGGFSGHGFKFTPVVGEIVAQLALDGKTAVEIGFLSLARFAADKRSRD